MSQTFLHVDDVSVSYGRTRVLEGLDLSVERGEFIALLGASGCGKSTLLRTIAGFAMPSSGRLSVAGREVTHLPPDRRGMALMFQSYALWPHMTVAANIGYGLKLRGRKRPEIAARVTDIQSLLGLDGLGERLPGALSGGQRQRVALGRALAIDPDILLLDEPLSNLDARIRLSVRHELSALQKRLGITTILVTHDREEAMVMADRIVILDAGRIIQAGRPEEMYNRPNSAFVAAFLGAENLLAVTVAADDTAACVTHPAATGAFRPATATELAPGAHSARFRPEAGRLLRPEESAPEEPGMVFAGTVRAVSYPGGHWRHSVAIGDDIVLIDAPAAVPAGAAVRVFVPAALLFLFPWSDDPSARESSPRSTRLMAA